MGDINSYTQEELLEALSGKDEVFLDAVYIQCFKKIENMVTSINGTEQDAEDVFQEVMIVFYRKLLQPEFELTSALSTYLYAIARNYWLKELELRKKMPIVKLDIEIDIKESQSIIDTIQQHARLKLYREKYELLSADCKRVLQMFINRIPIRDITKAMGYKSDQHTKNRRLRCKNTLIKNIRNSDKFKELGYGKNENDNSIPRW